MEFTDVPQGQEPAGVIAYSFVLPYAVPLSTEPVQIYVGHEYLRIRGVDSSERDHSWMQDAFTCFLSWSTMEHGVDPVYEGSVLASTVLDKVTGRAARETQPETANLPHERSVVVVMVPVKERTAALTPPHDGKVDPLTLAHWLVADTLRSLRITAGIPLPELHYKALNPITPAVFGTLTDAGSIRFDEDQLAIVLDHLPVQSIAWDLVDAVAVGNVFTQLTLGSVSALIRDHHARSHAEHVAGDYRASVLSNAITCEVALDTTLAAMLWEEDKTPAEAARMWADASSITHRVKTMYAHRLGASWNLDIDGPVADWRHRVVDVRNSLIHSGRTTSVAESDRAGECAADLISFISMRLVLAWKTYPKTLAVMCGPSSVDQYASKNQRANIHKALETNSASAGEFHRWRDDWLKARASL
ncbi:hypothetical protein ASG84_26160 [Rhodococcus sp. Leaf278]|uniref:hypothetical protein n=1 Tax=Rhodococcus sp. Leaf278 TaxID=1736319 RepID=UPI00070CA34A|nr:hypothetical protein [Rhodococcus sp. Leaf278]KQU50251.1 hypothetical protein ASG84_26160 [Rhodococcus sp. Leaf278]